MRWYVIPIICLIAFVSHTAIDYARNNTRPEPVIGVVAEKYVVGGDRPKYRIVVQRAIGDRETFELRDTMFGGFRSADDYARLSEGSSVSAVAYGWRSGILSQFRRLGVK